MSRYYRAKILMLKGEKGETGYSISNIQMNDDYTLTITIENGMQFNTPPIRGEKGEQGTGIQSVELRDDYSLLFTLDNGETLETTAILGKEFENIRKLEASATSASKIATNASTSASASAQSASEASISASKSASNASTSASASAQSATNASQSATNAQESASSASTSADTATSKATEASASATKAKEYEMNAKSSETNASNSAKEAEASAVNAKKSETKAEEYADNLQNSTETISKLNNALVNQKKAISELSDKKITKFYAGNLGETQITDSDNGKIMDMLIYGKSWQDKTTGKNLFDFSKLTHDDTFTIDYNRQTITVPPKTNNVGYLQTLRDVCPTIASGTYSLSMNNSNAEATKVIHLLETDKDFTPNTPMDFTDADLDSHIAFYNNPDSNVKNVISNIQIEQGSSATAYESYTGTKPSPSPTYPHEINRVVCPVIKLCGANLLKLDFATTKAKGIEIEVVGNKIRFHGTFTDTITYFDLKDKLIIKKGTEVSLYTDDNSEHDVFVWLKRIGSDEAQTLSKQKWATITTNMDRTLSTIGIRGYNVGDTIDITITIAVLEGTDKYEPYKEQTLTLPITLNAVPVATGGNVTINGQQYVADYVDVERGKVVRMTKRVNMNDVNPLTNLSFGQHSNGVGYLAYSISDSSNETAMKDVKPLSNKYIGSKWINKGGYVYVPSARSVIFVDDRFTDRDTAINLFKDVYIIYVMITPTEEDLTAEQIKALKALKTYYPTTNISTTSSQLDGYTVFNYPISLANGWNYVKKQLNDNRDYIYDMDLQSAEAYVNSEYAVTLTELEV